MPAKRRYKINIFGNIVGYEGRCRVIEFGAFAFPNCLAERQAKAWVNHAENWKEA